MYTSSPFSRCVIAMPEFSSTDPEVLLAQPRGFCAGVDRAIEIVERAPARFGAPVYVRHESVHNTVVVNELRRKGVIFVEALEQVPAGGMLIFSAHSVSKKIQKEAEHLGLRVWDATCPLAKKVHVAIAKMRADGDEIVMIGNPGHPEVEGTMGHVQDGVYLVEDVHDVAALRIADPKKLAYVTQTTLSVDDTWRIIAAHKARFPEIRAPKKQDICYASQNRQDAVKWMAPLCDMVIVVGSPNSSNSNRLREVAGKRGIPAYQIDAPEQINPGWLTGKRRIGLTAGASAPEALAQAVIQRLRELGVKRVRLLQAWKKRYRFHYRAGYRHRFCFGQCDEMPLPPFMASMDRPFRDRRFVSARLRGPDWLYPAAVVWS